MTTKFGRVFFTHSIISDSSATSPTISMSGWSANVVRIVSRKRRGRFATRTRMAFSMGRSVRHKYLVVCQLAKDSKEHYRQGLIRSWLGGYQTLVDTNIDPIQFIVIVDGQTWHLPRRLLFFTVASQPLRGR